MLMLALSLLVPGGRIARAETLCRDASALAPNDPEVRALVQAVRSRSVGGWYFTMVRDERRHALYADAFREVFPPDCTVLDVGAGTGLFAMIAAQEGAARVIACERNPFVADAAREIVELNGFGDRVKVVAKDSRQLQIGTDLDGSADVLVWDNLSNDLFGAGALDVVDDARRRLLKRGAPIVPNRCEVRVALVESNRTAGTRTDAAAGFDISPFNRLRPSQVTVAPEQLEWRSDSASLFDVDFAAAEPLRSQRNRAKISAIGGKIDGIVQWLRFHISEGVIYDTRDDQGVTAFGMQYHAVEPFDAAAGQELTIAGAHDRQRSWFWVEPANSVAGE